MSGEPGSRGSKARGLTLVGLAYLLGLAAALAAGTIAREQHPLIVIGLADLVGTLVVFAFSVAHDNTSVYDPYWSVAPIPIALFLAWVGWESGPPAARVIAVVALVALWGNRLTYSWARGWPGLHHEDWRYNDVRPKTGSLFWPGSFFGFQLFPTVIVFVGCLPLYAALTVGYAPLNWLDGVALVVTLGAVWIEATADKQLCRYLQSSLAPGATFEGGLWAYSRHPNYFGEVGFWFGLWIFGLAAAPATELWWIAAGPALMTLLFLFVSIPLIERRMLARRPDYPERIRRVSRIIPWFPKR